MTTSSRYPGPLRARGLSWPRPSPPQPTRAGPTPERAEAPPPPFKMRPAPATAAIRHRRGPSAGQGDADGAARHRTRLRTRHRTVHRTQKPSGPAGREGPRPRPAPPGSRPVSVHRVGGGRPPAREPPARARVDPAPIPQAPLAGMCGAPALRADKINTRFLLLLPRALQQDQFSVNQTRLGNGQARTAQPEAWVTISCRGSVGSCALTPAARSPGTGLQPLEGK